MSLTLIANNITGQAILVMNDLMIWESHELTGIEEGRALATNISKATNTEFGNANFDSMKPWDSKEIVSLFLENLKADHPSAIIATFVSDLGHEVQFNAEEYFTRILKNHTLEFELTELENDNFGGGEASDRVVEHFCSDFSANPQIIQLRGLRDSQSGYSCHINQQQLNHWIQQNAPKLSHITQYPTY